MQHVEPRDAEGGGLPEQHVTRRVVRGPVPVEEPIDGEVDATLCARRGEVHVRQLGGQPSGDAPVVSAVRVSEAPGRAETGLRGPETSVVQARRRAGPRGPGLRAIPIVLRGQLLQGLPGLPATGAVHLRATVAGGGGQLVDRGRRVQRGHRVGQRPAAECRVVPEQQRPVRDVRPV